MTTMVSCFEILELLYIYILYDGQSEGKLTEEEYFKLQDNK